MKKKFSSDQPNNMRDLINVLLKGINFFEGTDKSPLPNDEVKRDTLKIFRIWFAIYEIVIFFIQKS